MMKQFSYRHTKEAELMDSMEQAAKGAPQTDEELFPSPDLMKRKWSGPATATIPTGAVRFGLS